MPIALSQMFAPSNLSPADQVDAFACRLRWSIASRSTSAAIAERVDAGSPQKVRKKLSGARAWPAR